VTEPASWTDLVNESVHTSDDRDIGDIEAISRDFAVVKRGIVNVHYYYVPLVKVEGWDGRVVWLKISEEEAKKYERDSAPDPHHYYYSSAPPADEAYFIRDFQINMPKIPPRGGEPFVASEQPKEEPTMYRCDLCMKPFRTADELSSHVASH
jgi:hypothetical protein